MNVVIFGAPGSGKGTQSEKLIDKYGLYHISTGEVLRDHINRKTPVGQIAKTYINQGQLIPDSLMIRILEEIIDNEPKAKDGVIFDGFPRTIPQAEALNRFLAKRGQKIHHVIGLEVPEEELMGRMLKRGKETGRADDNPETIKNRLKVYHQSTTPLRDFYINEGKYRAIPGSGDIDEIFGHIAEAIDKHSDE
ncbi:MAG: adenylate kinase [Muribaculaceae bacterium]|nr:adenylate kinase [Muribaculaceae bacterium]